MMLNVFSPRHALRLLIGGKSVLPRIDPRDGITAALARQRLALADAMQLGHVGGIQASGLAADLDRIARLMGKVGKDGRLTAGLRSYLDAELHRHGQKLSVAATLAHARAAQSGAGGNAAQVADNRRRGSFTRH